MRRTQNILVTEYSANPDKIEAWWSALPVSHRRSFSISADAESAPTREQIEDITAGMTVLGLTWGKASVQLAEYAAARSYLEAATIGAR